jgi:Zn ribbon nucleic-acid-binding protein
MKSTKEPETEFEEVIAHCVICGKDMKVYKRKGASLESVMCQKCGHGEMEAGEGGED